MRKGLDLYNAPIKAALATSHGKFKQDEPMPDLSRRLLKSPPSVYRPARAGC